MARAKFAGMNGPSAGIGKGWTSRRHYKPKIECTNQFPRSISQAVRLSEITDVKALMANNGGCYSIEQDLL
ncbi:hypothetical protein ACCC97_11835 [Variovorax sp. Varisp85]|uniref:hypothetical protein n=1 Tax=Variovorax sp. Varisp85 TaxID=3243059 RepID=UPI0039A72473